MGEESNRDDGTYLWQRRATGRSVRSWRGLECEDVFPWRSGTALRMSRLRLRVCLGTRADGGGSEALPPRPQSSAGLRGSLGEPERAEGVVSQAGKKPDIGGACTGVVHVSRPLEAICWSISWGKKGACAG